MQAHPLSCTHTLACILSIPSLCNSSLLRDWTSTKVSGFDVFELFSESLLIRRPIRPLIATSQKPEKVCMNNREDDAPGDGEHDARLLRIAGAGTNTQRYVHLNTHPPPEGTSRRKPTHIHTHTHTRTYKTYAHGHGHT